MRLLHSRTRQLKDFLGDDNLPRYAILSHTWGEGEVSYQDMLLDPSVVEKAGYKKIEYSCAQAADDDLEWVWIDTYGQQLFHAD
jgi:hypothetical protein